MTKEIIVDVAGVTANMIDYEGSLAFLDSLKEAALNRVMNNVDTLDDFSFQDLHRETDLAMDMNTFVNLLSIELKLKGSILLSKPTTNATPVT